MIHLVTLNALNAKLPNPDECESDTKVYNPKEWDTTFGYKTHQQIVFKKEFIRGKNRWVLQTPIVMHTDLD